MGRRIGLLGMLLWILPAAADPQKRPLDVTVPPLSDIPKAEGLTATPQKAQPDIKRANLAARYSVLQVQHARAFLPKQTGTLMVGPLTSVPLAGAPLSTEKFSTRVRLKCSEGVGAPIEVTIQDARGETALSSTGHVSFRPGAVETDYFVDWDPTPVRAAGTYEVRVRVAGESLGSWPLAFSAPK
jgi:hypothetical protein